MGSLSQPRLNIFTVCNMRVMICLGQGGLRSLSASSLYIHQLYGNGLLIILPEHVIYGTVFACILVSFFVVSFSVLSVVSVLKVRVMLSMDDIYFQEVQNLW